MSGEAEGEGARAKHRADVRGRLVGAALDLFGARGFDAVTIDEIAAAADVSRRTFFRYFPTKEDVVVARRLEQLARFRALLGETAPGSPFQRVRDAFGALAQDYTAMRRRVLAEHALFDASPALTQRDLAIDRAFEAEIALALTAGVPGNEPRARLCAGAIMGVLRVVIEDWARAKGRGDLAQVGGEALDLLEPLAP